MTIFTHDKFIIEYEYIQGAKKEVIVFFHPHPLYEGTMMNKVITTSCIAAKQLGYSFLRFNFSGVGQSNGCFGFGLYEANQALTLISNVVREPIKYLVGFSFGCNVIQYVWQQQKIDAIWIGASINPLLSSASELSMLKGMIHGMDDRLCLVSEAELFAEKHYIPFTSIPNADHFFNGQQIILREKVKELFG